MKYSEAKIIKLRNILILLRRVIENICRVSQKSPFAMQWVKQFDLSSDILISCSSHFISYHHSHIACHGEAHFSCKSGQGTGLSEWSMVTWDVSHRLLTQKFCLPRWRLQSAIILSSSNYGWIMLPLQPLPACKVLSRNCCFQAMQIFMGQKIGKPS